MEHNRNCLDKVQTGTSAEGHIHYDHRTMRTTLPKKAGNALGSAITQNSGGVCSTDGSISPTRPDLGNLGIGHNRIWTKADKVDSKFRTIKDRVTLRRTFSKYRIVILTREEWGKNWPNQLRKGHVWFTDGACNQ